MQNSAKMAPSTSSTSIRPVSRPRWRAGDAELLGLQLGAERWIAEAQQGGLRRLKLDPMAGPGHQRRGCARLGRGRPPSPAATRPARSIPSPVLAEISIRSRSARRTCARSILFNTKRGAKQCGGIAVFSGSNSAIAVDGKCHTGAVASTSHSTRSASSTRANARLIPSASTLPRASRIPAVSTRITGHAAEVEMHLDHIARGARLLRDDRHVALGERIQQRRLAGVGRSGDDDAEAVAQALAAMVGKMARDRGEQAARRWRRP